jgi:transposase, IS6 family
LELRLRRHLKPTKKSWRVDETYIRVKGRWWYLYRAIASKGDTTDFLLSASRDTAMATRLFRQALSNPLYLQPRVINTDHARLNGLGDCRNEIRRAPGTAAADTDPSNI